MQPGGGGHRGGQTWALPRGTTTRSRSGDSSPSKAGGASLARRHRSAVEASFKSPSKHLRNSRYAKGKLTRRQRQQKQLSFKLILIRYLQDYPTSTAGFPRHERTPPAPAYGNFITPQAHRSLKIMRQLWKKKKILRFEHIEKFVYIPFSLLSGF